MSIPLDTNLFAALAIVLPLAAGAFALQTRRKNFQRREHELIEAIALLDIHTMAMRKLDDDRVPSSLIYLVCALSRLMHDPAVLSATVGVMRDGRINPAAITPEVQSTIDEVNRDFAHLLEQEPELATTYIQALFGCILAFEKRHPECAGQFSLGLPQMVSSPVQEAQRIVRAASNGAAWTTGPIEAIAA